MLEKEILQILGWSSAIRNVSTGHHITNAEHNEGECYRAILAIELVQLLRRSGQSDLTNMPSSQQSTARPNPMQ
eukprot:1779663-Rhodomonas_salina.1